MVDILGVGVLIRGRAASAKAEAVLALIERGYSLVSDDVTKVILLGRREVVGTCAEFDARPHGNPRHRHHNVAMSRHQKHPAIKKRLDLVVTLNAVGRSRGCGAHRSG